MSSPLSDDFVHASTESVPLSRLDLSERSHCLSFGRDLEPLLRSIQAIGLVQPPVVCRGKDDLLTVLSGFRRIEALVDLGVEILPCRVLDRSLDPMDRLSLAFWENLSHRGFNIVEKARAVDAFSLLQGSEKTMENVMPALGLHPHLRELERMKKTAGLPEPVLLALVDGRIFPDPAIYLTEFPESDRMPVFECLTYLNLNLNQQKEFLEMLRDLCLRDGVSARRVLEDEDVRRLLDHPAWSRPQKADRMKRWLKDQLNPRLKAAETAFDEQLRELRLPGRVRIAHAPFFEAEGLRVTMDAANGAELLETVRELNRVFESGGVEKLYDIVDGL
ncbi:MAG: ParB/RepB/Spo0J family partition protein [Deltaproteobacteria bacterium]|nr:ParB/RepB/Spo0J family partition protein [Deltaproteobacteria bacterium]